jgi:hypothetical protein
MFSTDGLVLIFLLLLLLLIYPQRIVRAFDEQPLAALLPLAILALEPLQLILVNPGVFVCGNIADNWLLIVAVALFVRAVRNRD